MGHSTDNRQDLQKRVDEHPFWHHTIEIMPGVVTPGWFDLRPVVDRMQWPDVNGKRCLRHRRTFRRNLHGNWYQM
jgi:hypothetical protein